MTDKSISNAQSAFANSSGVDKPRKRSVWILVSLGVFIGVLFFLMAVEDTIDVQQTKTPPLPPLVSIETIQVNPQSAEISAFAEVKPQWSAELRAAVSGRITEVLPSALAGERVQAGTTLITIENSQYAAQLSAAELTLKETNLNLLKAKNATLLARKEFKRTGKKPPNDLALHLPQLEIAKTSVASAEARVLAAKRQLEEATIVAPFSAFVTERFVSPGQTVNVGDSLVKLADNTTFELVVELGRNDWSLLKKPIMGLSAQVNDQNGQLIAQAEIRQGGGFLDETTRQYKVYLEVKKPGAEQLLSGDFVRVLLPGVTVQNALDIPASSLTQEGHIWYLDAQDRLQRLTPTVLFRHDDRIVIKAPQSSETKKETWRVATTPLVSFLPGQKARPQNVEG
ncbi:efflux RND transporter periplasmic adaptor subunit [Aliikangiella coralliicola]|uniref:Efflux RND transporter periplasmic adaptor subunit n=1 Tax=Aliikangiella coralliicola TaxID=2592383 RepID=A0A545UJ46_9GAMM|nr:efflux RND transporter periplasmic adaptor subunit [Aliikangiella coralliicola]TQV89494.1 efflux RND transporter periplasmic adaptor subunit [Aliikangiella coralliicola]